MVSSITKHEDIMKVPQRNQQDINHQSPDSVGGRYKQVKDSFYMGNLHELQTMM